jgi:hypothetical protein
MDSGWLVAEGEMDFDSKIAFNILRFSLDVSVKWYMGITAFANHRHSLPTNMVGVQD